MRKRRWTEELAIEKMKSELSTLDPALDYILIYFLHHAGTAWSPVHVSICGTFRYAERFQNYKFCYQLAALRILPPAPN